jgi:hypothetical protein
MQLSLVDNVNISNNCNFNGLQLTNITNTLCIGSQLSGSLFVVYSDDSDVTSMNVFIDGSQLENLFVSNTSLSEVTVTILNSPNLNLVSATASSGTIKLFFDRIPETLSLSSNVQVSPYDNPRKYITGTTQTLKSNTTYSLQNSTLCTLTLPSSPQVLDYIEIVMSTWGIVGGFTINQQASEQIVQGTTSTISGTGHGINSLSGSGNTNLKLVYLGPVFGTRVWGISYTSAPVKFF